ncbi:MAG TPA: hypothetical protein VML75_24375 [Kofleriaceae bacterium]|nr:hypothetical protein [Kofleriaceae bacterium]
MAKQGGTRLAALGLALSGATLIAVLVGTWLLWRGLDRIEPPVQMKGTFCCRSVEGKTGGKCQPISGDIEAMQRCVRQGDAVLDCTGSHSQTPDGTVSCF